MIKIFITVGTTPFDSLIKHIDENIDCSNFNIIAQISDEAKYIPKNIKYFNYCQDIIQNYQNADIIISHAGAGSVYKLLEMNKKVLFVPNTEMKDNHQMDICKWIINNNYGGVLTLEKNDLNAAINNCLTTNYKLYSNKNNAKLAIAISQYITNR